MRRDMELIRTILIALEEKEDTTKELGPSEIPGYSKEEVSYHFEMLSGARLIKAKEYKNIKRWCAISLTWDGHDFLDAVKNPKIWEKAKSIVKEKGGIFSIEILKKILLKLAMGYVFPESAT